MKNYIEFYVLYDIEDKTYLSNTNIWQDNLLEAIKYNDINRIKEIKSYYDEAVQISKITIEVKEDVLI